MASSFGSTLAGGSDVYRCCEYCDDDREAVGYCTNCKGYLCADCFRTHLKPIHLRHHVLLDRSQMPCPDQRHRRDADSDTGSQHGEPVSLSVDEPDSSSTPSHSEQTSGMSGRPNNVALPGSTENSSINDYRHTRSPRRPSLASITVLIAVLALLSAWLTDRHFREIIKEPQTDGHFREIVKEPQTDGHFRGEHVSDILIIDDEEIDMEYNFISSSVIMSGEKLVTVSNWSSKLKLVDLKTNTVIAELTLPEYIWDITQVSNTQVAVTSPFTQTIHFVTANDEELKLDHSVKINGRCVGIICLRESLLVTYRDPANVKILTVEGQVIKTIVTETHGEQMFTVPEHVAVSPDQSTIYISDWNRDTVVKLSVTGEFLEMYQDKDVLNMPHGVAVDTSGNVYVCGTVSNNVVQLAADLTQPRVLLQESDGIKRPASVSYCQATDRLYIGMRDSRVIKVYQLNSNVMDINS